jgi:hypothetical protein
MSDVGDLILESSWMFYKEVLNTQRSTITKKPFNV